MLLLLINLIFLNILLLVPGQNPGIAIILMNNWLTSSVILLIHLMLIKPLVLHLILGELKPIFLIILTVLSLTSLTIS